MTNSYRIQYTEVKPGGSHARQDVRVLGDRSDLVRYLSRECGNVLEGSVTIWENVGNISDRAGVNIGGLGWNPAPVEHPADTAAAADLADSVREYIEAEWRGAALVMSAKRGEVIAAILAADPSLSNTAATFRFHNLVAEMRDNDSIEPAERIAAAVAANDGLPLNVIPAEQGLAALEAIAAAQGDVIYASGDEVWYLGDTKRITGGVLARGERCTVKVGNEDYEDDVQVTVGGVVVFVQPCDLAMIF